MGWKRKNKDESIDLADKKYIVIKEEKKDGFFKSQGKGMFNSFVIKPFGAGVNTGFTKEMTGLTGDTFKKAISPSKIKELYKLYTNDELIQCEYDFEYMVKKEGLSEESIEKGIKLLEWIKAFFLFFIISIVVYSTYFISSYPLNFDTAINILKLIIILYIFGFIHTIMSWKVYRLRHRMLITHFKFMKLALRDFILLIPFGETQEEIEEARKAFKEKVVAKKSAKKKVRTKKVVNKNNNKEK